MGFLWSKIPNVLSKPPETPADCGDRVINIFKVHFRGILGTIPIILLPVFLGTHLAATREKSMLVIWLVMGWILLLHPVAYLVVGFVPTWVFPLLNIMKSDTACYSYFRSISCFFIIGGYARKLLNMSGVDKRVTLHLLCPDKNSSITVPKLLFKASLAAYILSLLSDFQFVVPYLMETAAAPLVMIQGYRSASDPDFNKLRYVLCNAIASSSTLGSLAMINGQANLFVMRNNWDRTDGNKTYSPDTFNFLDYTAYALPVTIVMFLFNLAWNIFMAKQFAGGVMSAYSMKLLRTEILNAKKSVKSEMSTHEIQTIILLILSLLAYYFRWSYIFKKISGSYGWSNFRKNPVGYPFIGDVTAATVIVLIGVSLPSTFNFVRLLKAKKHNQLPPVKTDSAILYFRFADKSTSYGYLLMLGLAYATDTGIKMTGCDDYFINAFKFVTDKSLCVVLLFVVILSGILCNIMTSIAAAVMMVTLTSNFVPPESNLSDHMHIITLAAGIGSSFGFMVQFKYNPPHASKVKGKVPLSKQAKYGIGSTIICLIILWLSLCFYAPHVFSNDKPIEAVAEVTTTAAAPAAAPPEI